MTAKHYASGDSVANARLARVAQALGTDHAQVAPESPNSTADLLAKLGPQQLEELRRLLVPNPPIPSHSAHIR